MQDGGTGTGTGVPMGLRCGQVISRRGRPKLETNTKHQCFNIQTRNVDFTVLIILIWIIEHYFEFRASDFVLSTSLLFAEELGF
jgi:hypothetical protein